MVIRQTETIFGIDFDGTCVTHEFPEVGKDIGAIPVLRKLVENGHKLILFTMRSDVVNPTGISNELHLESGNYLTDAVNWFVENDIPLYGIQTNPTQHNWTTSPKAYCHIYIDDAALGCPLTQYPLRVNEKQFLEEYGYNPFLSPPDGEGFCWYEVKRPYVDWIIVEQMLINKGYIV